MCSADGFQGSLVTAPDGLDGAVMVWQDHRGSTFGIYAQRIDPNGNVYRTYDGVLLNGAGDQQFHPWICGDGAGGAWITWNDRTGGYGSIYVQHLDSSGNPDWAPAGGGPSELVVPSSTTRCRSARQTVSAGSWSPG